MLRVHSNWIKRAQVVARLSERQREGERASTAQQRAQASPIRAHSRSLSHTTANSAFAMQTQTQKQTQTKAQTHTQRAAMQNGLSLTTL